MALLVETVRREQRKTFGRLERPRLPLRIDRAEKKHAVPHNRSAAFDTRVVQLCVERLDRAVVRLILRPRALCSLRPCVSEYRAPKVVRAALRDHVHDAAGGLAELGLVTARLD